MIPTAEEFFRNKIKQLHPSKEVVTLAGDLITAEQGMIWANEYSILKSQYHVTEALKSAIKKAKIETTEGKKEVFKGFGAGRSPVYGMETIIKIKEKSILNAYPIENIK